MMTKACFFLPYPHDAARQPAIFFQNQQNAKKALTNQATIMYNI